MLFFGKKKYDPEALYFSMLETIVSKGGLLTSSDIKKFKDPEFTKTMLNRMSKDGVITIGVIDGSNMEYIFPAVPVKYDPLEVQNTGEFFETLTEMGCGAEDGQIFLSEIIFAFKMIYDDITEALEMYSGSGPATRNISKSGNVYFMFDKDKMKEGSTDIE
jgi:hypothetical protein